MQSTQPSNSRPKRKFHWGPLIISLLFVGLTVAVLANRQYVVDSARFWQYQPSSEIEQSTNRIELTDYGKFLYYASHPSLDGNRTFDAKCDRKESNTAILGCYTGDKIYIFDVADERLNGIEEVTAAHELLHAAYQRLSSTEKTRVDGLIEAEYEKLKNDDKLAQRLAFYARTEPGERSNELHSIIGTEAISISPELETHYAKYFKDRKKIVSYYDSYHQVFVELEKQRDEMSQKLEALNTETKRLSEDYNTEAKRLDADIDTFNQRSVAGDFSSQAQFNRERAALVARVDNLTRQRTVINQKVAEYDTLRAKYNETVTASNDLYKSIDSSLAPAPRV